MIKKKICLLGAFAVGKTSLVQRYVHSLFSDKYLTTVGVKIDKKPVNINGAPVDLTLWDIYGEDEFQADLAAQVPFRLGYTIVAKTSSFEALALFKQDPAAFDLVITDLTMPQLTGNALAKKIHD
jgi:GTPase SAR1 family protein